MGRSTQAHDGRVNPGERRAFLGALGVAAAGAFLTSRSAGPARAQTPEGAEDVSIQSVDLFPVRYQTIGRFKFFEGPPGTPEGRAACLVKITASNGAFGWGESVPIPKWSYETLESVTSVLGTYIIPPLIGMDPSNLHSIHAVMDQSIAASFPTGMPIAKAGIDLALHDLCGRLTGRSLAERWGRPRGGPIALSWTLNPRTLDETEGLIQQGRERGYQNFNVKVAPDPEYDIELCRIVKSLVPDGFLWADANGGYDLATALDVAPKLADIGVPVLEQPLPANRLAGYQELKRQGALPIIMDEGVVSPADLMEFIRLDALDGVAMKPARCGGLLSARRQVEILEDAGLMFLGSGLTDPDVSLAASLALYGAYGLRFPAALNGPQFIADSVVSHRLMPNADGTIDVPPGPGLGVEVDEERLRELVASSA